VSRLLVVTRSDLAVGFSLAGVEAFPAPDVETATELIEGWLKEGEKGLLAIEDALLAGMDPGFVRRLETNDQLFVLAIPGGEGPGEVVYRQRRMAELIRMAIGFHSIFKTEKTETETL
jgi:vacuolar-type H+-ATPase subunit F/Vma7